MKFSISAILGVAAMATLSISAADEASDRFVTACISEGDTQVQCSCTAQAMQTTFTQAQFNQIVIYAEAGDHTSGGDFMESLFVAQPSLIDTFKATLAACE